MATVIGSIQMKFVAASMLLTIVIWSASVALNAEASCFDGVSANVEFTQYWIPKQGTEDMDDNGNTIYLRGPETKSIVDDQGKLIAKVDKTTYGKCQEEGTCYLSDGRLINLGDTDNTFQVVDRSKFPYGMGAFSNPLEPYVSVAADNSLAHGTTLLVKELVGFKLPNGAVHNGCVRVDDRGVNFSCHIDWFVLSYAVEDVVNPKLPEKAHVKVASCKVKTYM